MYTAYILWKNGEKYSVTARRADAVHTKPLYYWDEIIIKSYQYNTKQELENVIEDNLTDNEANDYLTKKENK